MLAIGLSGLGVYYALSDHGTKSPAPAPLAAALTTQPTITPPAAPSPQPPPLPPFPANPDPPLPASPQVEWQQDTSLAFQQPTPPSSTGPRRVFWVRPDGEEVKLVETNTEVGASYLDGGLLQVDSFVYSTGGPSTGSITADFFDLTSKEGAKLASFSTNTVLCVLCSWRFLPSPDLSRAAIGVDLQDIRSPFSGGQVTVVVTASGERWRLTGLGNNTSPLGWTPDGRLLVSAQGATYNVPLTDGPATRVAQASGNPPVSFLSEDRSRLIYLENGDLYIQEIATGDKRPVLSLQGYNSVNQREKRRIAIASSVVGPSGAAKRRFDLIDLKAGTSKQLPISRQ